MGNMFIVVEGIDGCGKGEQIMRLQNFFFEKDRKNVILTTREPTYGKYGLLIRKKLKEEKDPMKDGELMLELYSKDRKDHLDTLILPVLRRTSGDINHIALCDRYYHSTYAFQQTQGVDFEKIHKLQQKFQKPTITFILDIEPKLALSRISGNRQNSEKFEQLEFMTSLRKNYLKLKEQLDEKIYVVDGSKSKENVFNQIIKILNNEGLI